MSDSFADLHDAIAALRRRQVFFIGGAARSGTTWLQLLLDAHPAIRCRGEGHFCDSLRPLLTDALARHNSLVQRKNTTLFGSLEPHPQFTATHQRYLLTAAMALLLAEAAGDAPIVGEKTPDNLLHIPVLHALFPAARFVIIVRDGRDCAVSAWFHNQRIEPEGTRALFPDFAAFVERFAQGWAQCMDAALRFTAAYRQDCVALRYESLVRAPEATLAALLGFLGADTDAAVVRGCVEATSFQRLSGGRRPGQEDRGSLFRRGEIGDWRRHFTAATCETFERQAGAQLQRCGYALATPGGATGAAKA